MILREAKESLLSMLRRNEWSGGIMAWGERSCVVCGELEFHRHADSGDGGPCPLGEIISKLNCELMGGVP